MGAASGCVRIASERAERGVAGILVKYRVSRGDAAGYQFPVPFLDARRAIRTAGTIAVIAKLIRWAKRRMPAGSCGT